jgi:hypothetical protein
VIGDAGMAIGMAGVGLACMASDIGMRGVTLACMAWCWRAWRAIGVAGV